MSIFFTILSAAYIAGIFLWADSSIVEELSAFNPFSLLHIPLYGILTILLMFSVSPFKRFNKRNQINLRNKIDQISRRNQMNLGSLLFAGLIAFVVAIADEIHQGSIPSRDGSIVDVFLDLAGIVLVLTVIH